VKTEQLIDLLARGAGPAPRGVVARRLTRAGLAGVALSALLACVLIGPLPASTYAAPSVWLKFIYTGSLALAAALLAARAARPVARLRLPQCVLSCVLAAMALAAFAVTAMSTPPGERWSAVMGDTWRVCPWAVLALSLPALGLSLWAMRSLAPTQPRWAGGSAGLLAGALGAFGYSMACPESAPAFVAVWYTLGVGLTGLLGAVVGPKVLRW
jgi:hypothetical protein